MAASRFDNYLGEVTAPTTWLEWWQAMLDLVPYGVDPYEQVPPEYIKATGPRPEYTLP